jgi:phospholipid/cholesterol/gamma-HCH transport system ATP-binding protein
MNDQPMIQMINVRKKFGAQEVLKGVNLSIYEGKTTVIVGESGQGKSLVIKHILGLMKPTSGKVLVNGKDINKIRRKALKDIRSDFGVLFQHAALFDSMTVFENVALPLRERTKATEEEIKSKVTEMLDLMDLEGSDEKYPAQISGGMKKRVGLARALVLNPKIVFFDEPTTGLDIAKSNEIYRVFHRTQTKLGYTSVIVSHDVPKIFKLADYVALLYDGVIQDCISPEDFQTSENPVIKEFVEKTMGRIYESEQLEG